MTFRCTQPAAIVASRAIIAGLIILGSIFFRPGIASSEYGGPRYFTNSYLLTGEVGLIYDGRWMTGRSGSATEQTFTHFYGLGLQGYVLDSRLISYNLAGSFQQELDSPGGTINSRSFLASISLLNEKPRRGFFRNFPQPIELRYAKSVSGYYSEQNYGLSLIYTPANLAYRHSQMFQQNQNQQMYKRRQLQEQQNAEQRNNIEQYEESQTGKPQNIPPAQQNQQNRENQENGQNVQNGQAQGNAKWTGTNIPWPTLYLDYDKYIYNFEDSKTDTNRLDLRALSRSTHADLGAEYSYNSGSGVNSGKYQYLNLTGDLHYNDARSRLDVLNRLLLSDYSKVKSLDLNNSTTWWKYLDEKKRDQLVLWGGGDYLESDGARSYDVTASGSYSKTLTEALRNNVTVNFGYGGTDSGPLYLVSASNSLNYALSRRFTLTNRLAAGQTELGSNFAGDLGLTANTWPVTVSTDYNFVSSALDEGRATIHRFEVNFSGRLARNLSFSSRNSYHIADIGGGEPVHETGYDLRGDLYWNIWRLSANFGASHVTIKNNSSVTISGAGILPVAQPDGTGNAGMLIADVGSAGDSVDFSATSLYSNLSAPLSRSMFLTCMSSYTTDSSGESIIDVHPILNWYVRRVTLTAEYEMTRISGGESARTDHRIMVRLTRRFARRFGPFW